MIKKYISTNKKVNILLITFYVFLNLILAKVFINSSIATQLFSSSGVSQIVSNYSYVSFTCILCILTLLTAIFMTFIYRNLLKFIFTESNTWKTINFCYLISVIIGTVFSIIILLINKDVDIASISKVTNLTTALTINLLFHLFNKKPKEQIIVIIISIINSSVVFLF